METENQGVSHHQVVRRNGQVVPFDRKKIALALNKTFLAVSGTDGDDSAAVKESVEQITNRVVEALFRRKPVSGNFYIEEIQDQVELELMRAEHQQVARAYVIYRENHKEERRKQAAEGIMSSFIRVKGRDGVETPLDVHALQERAVDACAGFDTTNPQDLLQHALKEMHDGILIDDVYSAMYMAARSLIEKEPDYSQVSARLLLDCLRTEVFGKDIGRAEMEGLYAGHLSDMVKRGVKYGLLNPELGKRFDLERLGASIKPERDMQFGYLGLQTLYDRYFLHNGGKRIEMPQSFFMRVAMGLALEEEDPNGRAEEFYNLLSSFKFMSSTPTLFNSGTRHSQLSSCYLSTVKDDLDNIFVAYKDNALLAKFAGGLGNDWTPVRAMGAHIKGTNGKSQGIIPFLKIVNDTAVAVNQGGKRKGAVCTYLETWHLDIEEFLELRKNTGDDRRRTHDMNTANWVPDLFMKRVIANGEWTLFSPNEVPDLHDKYGKEFEKAYTEYEAKAQAGEMHQHKTISAVTLWRKMIGMLYETGHPWITFKDVCNIRSPQKHIGVVHSSNLCTEITLNTNEEEIAVCNLGSVNLPAHMKNGKLDDDMLASTIKTAMRMLDNVIDINFYAVAKAKRSNVKHRPVGLGLMGFQDCLYEQNIAYNSQEAVDFADRASEAICYHAYWASTELAEERGKYETFDGSLWSQGILPLDSIKILAKERGDKAGDVIDGEFLQVDTTAQKDWGALRKRIKKFGMRNSNCVAIAPTATIANIVGVTASIEPTYQNIFVKSNLSGEFTVSNRYLVNDLKELGIWDDVMLQDIKYFDGHLGKIDRIPQEIKDKYPSAFEVEPAWLIECAARRQKWIDQAQSLNLYIAEPSGKKLDEMYKLAWLRGIKTTYYLRSLGATSTEKYTAPSGALNAVNKDAA